MKRKARRGVVVTFAFATMLGVAAPAMGEPVESDTAIDATETGCILRTPGRKMRFLEVSGRDRRAVAESMRREHAATGTRVANPCLTGEIGSTPAARYAALAARHPDKFEPLPRTRPVADAAPRLAGASNPQYRFVAPDASLPPGFFAFLPRAISNGGPVYAQTVDDVSFASHVAVIDRGRIEVWGEGVPVAANNRGVVVGYVIVDVENELAQAAIFRDGVTELLPRSAGEVESFATRITDSGTVLVQSVREDGTTDLLLYRDGVMTRVDLPAPYSQVSRVDINNNETISGTAFMDGHYRGFRLDTRTGTTSLLKPQPTEPEAWALGINSHGDVVGYSFSFGGLERIGVWDRHGDFTTYFIQGTKAIPTVSNSLRINDSNTIVITFLSFDTAPPPYTSYVVPRPGMRLDLRDITSAFPEGYTAPSIVAGINSSGDLCGFNFFGFAFLLERGNRSAR